MYKIGLAKVHLPRCVPWGWSRTNFKRNHLILSLQNQAYYSWWHALTHHRTHVKLSLFLPISCYISQIRIRECRFSYTWTAIIYHLQSPEARSHLEMLMLWIEKMRKKNILKPGFWTLQGSKLNAHVRSWFCITSLHSSISFAPS